jgi:hypothetical protein
MRAGFRSLRIGGSRREQHRPDRHRYSPLNVSVPEEELAAAVDASGRRVGPIRRRMHRKACSWRRSRHWPPIGPRITTGAVSKSASLLLEQRQADGHYLHGAVATLAGASNRIDPIPSRARLLTRRRHPGSGCRERADRQELGREGIPTFGRQWMDVGCCEVPVSRRSTPSRPSWALPRPGAPAPLDSPDFS